MDVEIKDDLFELTFYEENGEYKIFLKVDDEVIANSICYHRLSLNESDLIKLYNYLDKILNK